SVLLSLVGGAAGVILAVWGVDLLKNIGASTVPRLREVNLDFRVLMMTFGIAVGTGILFGLVPGLACAKPDLTESLKEGGRGSGRGKTRSVSRLFSRHRDVFNQGTFLYSSGQCRRATDHHYQSSSGEKVLAEPGRNWKADCHGRHVAGPKVDHSGWNRRRHQA